MSASREKKQRQNDPAQGLTQKQQKELQEKKAAKRRAVGYTVLGVIVVILVAALLVWNSGIFQRRVTAVSVGGREYTVTDVEYYYNQARISEYYNAAFYGTSSYDSTVDPAEQYVDEAQTQTYHDYFLEQAVNALTEAAALENAAAEAGYTLTDEDKASVEENYETIRQQGESSGYTNMAGYLKAAYGKYMTPAALRTCLERVALINGYYNSYYDSLEYTDEEIQAYYEENKDDLDSYTYRYVFVDGSVPETTDENGETVEPTDAETQAAMQAAKAQADSFQAALEASDDKETTFAELAPDFVSETSRANYEEDPDFSLHTTMGNSLPSGYSSWLKESGRTAGDVSVIESGSGYYVVLFLGRALDETPTADIRHILVKAELTQEDDAATEDVDESTIPTQEALDAAKAEAEDLLAQWESGDKTADSFGALAEEYSDDTGSNTNGGMYNEVYKGYFSIFDSWLFGEDHQSGDTTLIENTNSGQQGWCVVYFQDWNDPTWKLEVLNTFRSEDVQTWLTDIKEGLEAVQGDGMKYMQ